MKQNYFKHLLIAFLLVAFYQFEAQCSFTGLNASYCTNSAASTLVPGITGGTFSGPGISGSVFTPAVAGAGTHTITYSTCSATYAISQPAFAPTSTVGATVALTDDSESAALPIGFTFKYFCVSYTNFYISSNGFIEFAATGNGCCSGQALPNNTTPNNLIAYCWNDLNPGAGGTITYTTTGASPNRTLSVSFVGVPYFSGGSPIYSQIRLVETSNLIEIHSTTISGNGSACTMGIENSGGTVGYPVPGRSGTSGWTATNEAYRWTPGTACLVTNTTQVNLSAIAVTGNTPICNGGTASLTAGSNLTYTWSTTSNSSSITVSPTSNTNYTVSGTNAFGCNSSTVVTIAVNNPLSITASASTGTNASCPNNPVTLTGAGGASSYAWSGGVTNAVAFNPTVSATYTVTGSNACGTATAAVSLTINPLPPISGSAANPTICSGSPEILSGSGGVSYTWTPTVTDNVAFFPVASGNYTVRGSSAQGCTATAVVGITVLITPTIAPVSTPTSMCQGVTATLSAVGATGYTWSPGSNLNAPTLTVSPPVSTTYTLSRTNGACSSTSTVNLVVFALPQLNASGTPNQLCAGTGVNLVITGATTNTWSPGNFTSSNFTLFPNVSTTYTVIGSNGNCTATAVVPLTVSPSPVISISSSTTTICQGASATLTAGGGALTYTWLPSNTSNSVLIVNPSTTSIYTLSGTNSFSCSSSVNQLLTVNPAPSMSLTTSVPYICVGVPAVVSVANPAANVVYNWDSGPAGPTFPVSPIITTTYTATGTNTITGCINTNTVVLTVYISTFVVTSPTAICKGQTATLTAVGPATSYSWATNGGIISPSITVSPVLNTVYYVTGTTGNCETTASVSLMVNPIPNVVATAVKPQICRLEVSTIIASGASNYLWDTGASTPTISFTLSLTTTYTLTGTDVNGCSKTTTVTQYVATCIGIEDLGAISNNNLNIYPNPNNGSFIISSEVNITLSIVNALGQVFATIALTDDNKKEVNVNNLPNGVYFITGQANDVKINKKIIVQR